MENKFVNFEDIIVGHRFYHDGYCYFKKSYNVAYKCDPKDWNRPPVAELHSEKYFLFSELVQLFY